ncbi:MAG: aminotransferase class I/II-fold pyridoxal phosphate-dependent enzyme [Actinomycetota bacterium]
MANSTTTIAGAVSDHSAEGIARGIGMLVSSNGLTPGSRLPTVRELATALNVSPTTVGDAWRILRRHRIIDTEGRRGSFVRSPNAGPTIRYWRVPTTRDAVRFDLCSGVPDARLLPNPLAAMNGLDETPVVASYLERPVVSELEHLLRARWPFEPQKLTMLNGAMDALDRLITAMVTVGDKVGISDPGFPPLFDMLDLAGAQTLPLPLDDEGLDPDAVRNAVDAGMSVLIIQPRAHNPTGVSMTQRRRDEIASILADRPVLIFEDDHSGAVSGAELHSFGSTIPDQVVHVRSFSKSHGPDFRLAAVGGTSEAISLVERRRMLGPSWTSRLLQKVLFTMLSSPGTEASVMAASEIYATRRAAVVDGLGTRGVTVGGTHGLNVWIPVREEATAVPMLAAHGIGVARGKPFILGSEGQDFIRVTTSALDNDRQEILDRLAEASFGESNVIEELNGGHR